MELITYRFSTNTLLLLLLLLLLPRLALALISAHQPLEVSCHPPLPLEPERGISPKHE
jgi:hypothetical protein